MGDRAVIATDLPDRPVVTPMLCLHHMPELRGWARRWKLLPPEAKRLRVLEARMVLAQARELAEMDVEEPGA